MKNFVTNYLSPQYTVVADVQKDQTSYSRLILSISRQVLLLQQRTIPVPWTSVRTSRVVTY